MTEKLALALVVTARKMRPYFQACTVVMMIDQHLRRILQSLDIARRLVKWAIELGEYDIKYRLHTVLKAQALVEFVVEMASINLQEKEKDKEEDREARDTTKNIDDHPTWTLFVDGVSNEKGSGARLVLEIPNGFAQQYALKFSFGATNNEVEYEALITELKVALEMGETHLRAHSHSQLVVN